VLEPFITPALFEPYADSTDPVVDEWGLSITWGANLSTAMEDHVSS
jgi:glucan 1,3-beta-glucosidase